MVMRRLGFQRPYGQPWRQCVMKVTADIRVSDSEEDMYKRPGLLSLSFLAVSSSQILDANQVSNYDSLMFVLSNLFQKSVGDGFI
ncbi:hypothetical protein CK203_080509 [Vitis vinifera]|uniref:Uncharacterized protein n=1 Tax=Vitis vinifera TaxID=29760 RepID=A0A438E7F3_VITVI|nr:hypothetical protein CK203_080509 [Vitis vinifera]